MAVSGILPCHWVEATPTTLVAIKMSKGNYRHEFDEQDDATLLGDNDSLYGSDGSHQSDRLYINEELLYESGK